MLGSATPSIESYYNAVVLNKYDLVSLDERYNNLQLPFIELINIREKYKEGKMVGIFSDNLLEQISKTVNEKKQVIAAHGIPENNIINVSNPYYAKEILFDYDPSEVEAVYFVGAKDMAENPRFKKTEGTTKEGYKWSIEVAPHVEKDVEGFKPYGPDCFVSC